MATSLLSGAAFGSALVVAGVYKPSVIISQVKFENYHMIQSFLAATATSTLAVTLLDDYAHVKPRSSSSLGLFSRYDGNIVGGSLLGAGLAFSGACPGTVLVQAAVGVRSGWYALGGAVLAGIAWTGLLGPVVDARKREHARDSAGKPDTVYEAVHVGRSSALVGLELMFGSIIFATVAFTAPSPFHPLVAPVVGGLLIGAAQIFSLLTRRSLVGVSTVYEDVGKHFWSLLRAFGGSSCDAKAGGSGGSYSHILFAGGIMASSFAFSRLVPEVAAGGEVPVSPSFATLGGALAVLGARLAGGCTSGHGISGVSLMSTSSFLTITFMFGGAALIAPFII